MDGQLESAVRTMVVLLEPRTNAIAVKTVLTRQDLDFLS
jgi:hypothetical protein